MKELIFPVLSSSYSNLELFDFSFKDIYIYDIQSDEFESYVEKLNPDLKKHNLRFAHQISKDIRNEQDKKYVVVKGDINSNYNYEELFNVYSLLLIMFPSSLQMEHSLEFYEDEGQLQCLTMTSWKKRFEEGLFGDPLLFLPKDLPEINEFIKNFFDNIFLKNYIGIAIENYLLSYSSSYYHYQFLSLLISLESTVGADTELNYRIKRTISILCGEDPSNCKLIYDNLNKIYSLRSKIVHGSTYSLEKVKEYLVPLKAIVSRTIIELLIHNIDSNTELNSIITQLGYGNRDKISTNWKNYKFNPITSTTLIGTRLK